MEKVWLKHYQTGVPAEINPDIYHSLNDMFDKVCEQYKDNPAFSNFGTVLSFKELDLKSRDFAAYLQSIGLKKGDRIAIMLPNLLQFPICMFGALRAGLIVVTVNPLYTPRELYNQLSDSGAKIIVVLANVVHNLQEIMKDLNLEHVIVTEVGDAFPFPKSFIVNFIVKYIKKMIPSWYISEVETFNEAMSKGKKCEFHAPDINGEDIAFLQYTGGTTGISKGAMLTHRNMVANIQQASAWMKPVAQGKEIIITALPLYHIFSLTANCFTFMMNGWSNILITNPRDIKAFIKELRHYQFTAITGVNTLFNAILNHPDFKKVDFSKLHIVMGGGMALQHSVAERWMKVVGVPMLEAYGLTEAAPAVCINPLNLKEFNGMVGVPVSSTDISIRDDKEQELSFNMPGELCVRGPQVMKGYWQKPEETATAMRGGWLHTGDIAIVNEEGFVKIIDRKKDVIFISGFNVYPNEVEDVIAMLPEVSEVAVIGVPADMGELVKAFIVKKDPTLTAQKITDHCRKFLTAYKIPKEIEFRKDLPKSNVGKILRRALKPEQSQKAGIKEPT